MRIGKKKKKGLTVETALWILMIMILDAFIFALYIQETVKNADVLNFLNNAFVAQGFVDYVMHNSCILARNEKGERMPFVANMSFLKANDGKDLKCLDIDPDIQYNILFYVPSFWTAGFGHAPDYYMEEYARIKNIDKSFKNPKLLFYMIDEKHRPVIMEVDFINFTNPDQEVFKEFVFGKNKKQEKGG